MFSEENELVAVGLIIRWAGLIPESLIGMFILTHFKNSRFLESLESGLRPQIRKGGVLSFVILKTPGFCKPGVRPGVGWSVYP